LQWFRVSGTEAAANVPVRIRKGPEIMTSSLSLVRQLIAKFIRVVASERGLDIISNLGLESDFLKEPDA